MSDPQSVGVSGFACAKCEMSGFAKCDGNSWSGPFRPTVCRTTIACSCVRWRWTNLTVSSRSATHVGYITLSSQLVWTPCCYARGRVLASAWTLQDRTSGRGSSRTHHHRQRRGPQAAALDSAAEMRSGEVERHSGEVGRYTGVRGRHGAPCEAVVRPGAQGPHPLW